MFGWKSKMKAFVRSAFIGTLALASMVAAAPSAFAGPIYEFAVSVGSQPSDVGKITLAQDGANSVIVYAELEQGYGFLNTGGPHTPFAFNLTSGATPTISLFSEPVDGIYSQGTFTLGTSGGQATPYGTFGIAINDSAGTGSSQAYYGDLQFTLTRVGGLSTDDFVKNGVNGYYFAADITDGANTTGSQAWSTRTICTANCAGVETAKVPEPGTLILFASGLMGLGILRRRRKQA
jgi:hypothetical protein